MFYSIFMPYRKSLIVSHEIYHVFNRSVAQQSIFLSKYDYKRALNLIDFYRFQDTNLRYSFYNRMKYQQKSDFMYSLYSTQKLVEIYSFCLMLVYCQKRNKINHGAGSSCSNICCFFWC